MKKLFFACAILFFAVTVNAQETTNAEANKEMKAKLKKLKEQNITVSFNEAGLTADEIKMARLAMEEAKEQSNKLKEDNSLSEADRNAKKDAINEAKNAKLKEAMKEKYKTWNEIRKRQKVEEEEMAAKIAQ